MAETVSQLLDRLLDQNYEDLALPVLNSFGATAESDLVKRRLAELNTEARRLESLGLKMDIQNPVLRAFTADLESELLRAAKVIDDNADNLLEGAFDAAGQASPALARLNALDPAQAARVLVGWNMVSVEALAAEVNFTSKPAWRDLLKSVGDVPVSTINNLALRGFVGGWNPLRVAREIADTTKTIPRATANTLMRTLYLQSYREATAVTYRRNSDVIETAIRMATLDNRTCPVCIALHGTEIEPGQPLEAHYQCRCTSIVKLRGVEMYPIPSGEQWFRGLPHDEQIDRLGPGAFALWDAGRIELSDLVARRSDPVWGTMLERRSLADLGYR